MKIIITDKVHTYASKCTDTRLVFQVVRRNFEKGTKKLNMPLNFITCIYGDLVCYIVNNNIKVILDSKRKWVKFDHVGDYFWWHDIEDYGKEGYCFKPNFTLTNPLALAILYSDKVDNRPCSEFKCYISDRSLKRLFSIELVYAFWEYQFALVRNIRDIETLKHHALYNEQAINWLIDNGILRKFTQDFKNRMIEFIEYIGQPIPKELPIMEV